jgi:alkylhydroperoxidase/carboxymuconolactone decarboxylase family protein YurZ
MKSKTQKKSDFLYPEFQYLSEKHPELYQHFLAVARYPIEKGKKLDLKTKLLIPMVILAHRGLKRAVYAHMKRALSMGVTEDEILEAFLVALLPGGAPTLHMGLSVLMETQKEMTENNHKKDKSTRRRRS